MKVKLPSMNLLVCFDAAARHLSFKDAAEELFVTPSAVGHQIRALESSLGVTLFHRGNRKVSLTDKGKAYHQQLAPAIKQLQAATASILQTMEQPEFTVHSFPFIASTLIIPNLKSFKALHQGLDIKINSSTDRVRFDSSKLEVAVRAGKEYDGMTYQRLFPLHITPVCAPDYSLQDKIDLICLSSDKHSWSVWREQWNMDLPVNENLECTSIQSLIELAEQGLGVAMGCLPLMKTQLESGTLIAPFEDKLSQIESIYLVHNPLLSEHVVVDSFARWLKALIELHYF